MNAWLIAASIFFMVLFIVIWIFQPYLNFRPWRNWFKTYDPEGKYQCFPINQMAYYYGPAILYDIVTKFEDESKIIQSDKTWYFDFLMSLMRGQAAGIVPGGNLIPKYLCESLVPDYDPIPGYPYGFPTPAGYDHWPNNIDDWKKLFADVWGQSYSDGKWNRDEQKWQSDTNFLFQMWGIPSTSPIVEAFVTNKAISSSRLELEPTLMYPLLGKNDSGAGGWYGLLRMGDDWGGLGIAKVQQILWADDVPDNINHDKQKTGGTCNWGSIVSGGISMGMGGAFAGAAIGGPIGSIIGGLIGTGVGGVLSAWSDTGCL